MFKKYILLIIIFIFIVIGFASYGYLAIDDDTYSVKEVAIISGGPKIEIPLPVHDFGIVIYGDVVEHIFTIKNTGNEPLQILKLSTSCGCTSASVAEDDKIIQPGEDIDMLVSFDPAVHKDDSDLGELTRIVYIVTNDENNPEIEAKITANVIKKNN